MWQVSVLQEVLIHGGFNVESHLFFLVSRWFDCRTNL